MLGHADAAMTLNIYGHLFPDRLDEVADTLDVRRREVLGEALGKLSASLGMLDKCWSRAGQRQLLNDQGAVYLRGRPLFCRADRI